MFCNKLKRCALERAVRELTFVEYESWSKEDDVETVLRARRVTTAKEGSPNTCTTDFHLFSRHILVDVVALWRCFGSFPARPGRLMTLLWPRCGSSTKPVQTLCELRTSIWCQDTTDKQTLGDGLTYRQKLLRKVGGRKNQSQDT